MTLLKDVHKLKNFLLELFFPSFCFGCQKEGTYLCQDCRETLEISQFQYCLCDKNPIRLGFNESKQVKCKRCSGKKLSSLHFALPYKEKALTRKLIMQFKYEPYIKDLAKTLAGFLAEHFFMSGKNTDNFWQNSVLIPVPLDKNKLKRRGYNQSEELSKELSEITKTPLSLDILVKTKKTPPQVGLSKKEREENIKNAFQMLNKDKIKDKNIFLVDDVYTTGSTMEECALILKESGAKSVSGISIAREEYQTN